MLYTFHTYNMIIRSSEGWEMRSNIAQEDLELEIVSRRRHSPEIRMRIPPLPPCERTFHSLDYVNSPPGNTDSMKLGGTHYRRNIIIDEEQRYITLKGFFYWEDVAVIFIVSCDTKFIRYPGWIYTGRGGNVIEYILC